mmetsp:Transcript_46982/g.92750  ORF Transcript_46982/g.92750 Transcript_46982/m.92750 type:complete len:269 (-) Transcript_46982:391-1197(-)
MVRLIVKPPLADHKIGPRLADALDHVREVFGLRRLELFEVLRCLDVQLVLGLRLGGFKWAGEDADFGVSDLFRHLGVARVFVNHNPLDQFGLLQSPSGLSFDLDQIEVHVPSLPVCHGQHSVHSDLGDLELSGRDHLGPQGSHGGLQKSVVIREHILLDRDLVHSLQRTLTGQFVSISYTQRVHSLLKQGGCLLEKSPCDDHHSRRAVSDFVVLGLGQLHQETPALVLDLHFVHNSCAIVCHGDVSVRADNNLVHPLGSQGGLQSVCN